MSENKSSCKGAYGSGFIALCLLILVAAGCQPANNPLPNGEEETAEPLTATAQVPTPQPTSIPTATACPLVDYAPALAELETYVKERVYDWGFDLGIAFVDIQTGQVISLQGDRRYHAMSSFKGPLAVQYYQMLENGETEPLPNDQRNMNLMLGVSYNQSTACFFEHVGGVPAFNDWLAGLGFDRASNFVFRWDEWACPEPAENPSELIDYRYFRGDEALGLPGEGALLKCVEPQLPCDKAFTPIELAEFYARLYQGEYISQDHVAELFTYMQREREESVFWVDMPEETPMQVFTKGGTHEATDVYRVNFFNEAGVIVTDHGAFAVAMFMQRQPEWPGTFPMAHAFRIFYDYFISVYG